MEEQQRRALEGETERGQNTAPHVTEAAARYDQRGNIQNSKEEFLAKAVLLSLVASPVRGMQEME